MSMNPKDEKNPSEKYKRVGAKYACKSCKKQFFTKEDAEECFDSH